MECTYRKRGRALIIVRRTTLLLNNTIKAMATICHAAFTTKDASQLVIALMVYSLPPRSYFSINC